MGIRYRCKIQAALQQVILNSMVSKQGAILRAAPTQLQHQEVSDKRNNLSVILLQNCNLHN
jgi:hypothetical protein